MLNNHNNITNKSRSSFTLIELLVTLAIVAVLSVVVVMTLNPAELLKQARDSNRLSDLATINTALNLFSTDVTSGFMGTSTVVYVSIPDSSPTCANLGLPIIPTSTGWSYNCVTSQNLRNTDGTGWIPVNFQRISSNSPISQLPIDPQNTTSTKYYTYVTGGSWQLAVKMESQKYQATAYTSGGADASAYTIGNNLTLAPFVGGLVGLWKFEEVGTSTILDSSGWGNHGIMYSSSTVTDIHTTSGCKSGAVCMGLDGVDDYANISGSVLDNLATAGNFSISGWAKTTTTQSFALISQGYGAHGNGRWFLGAINGYGISSLYGGGSSPTYKQASDATAYWVPNGTWNNITSVFSRSDGKIYLYINGTLRKSLAWDGYIEIMQANKISIGRLLNGTTSTYLLQGNIDEISAYNRALSAAEVLAIYNATK